MTEDRSVRGGAGEDEDKIAVVRHLARHAAFAPQRIGQLVTGEVGSGYWECFKGNIVIDSYQMDEICFITEGSATLIGKGGEERTLRPGDVVLIPKGAYSHWVIPERVKKVYFIAR